MNKKPSKPISAAEAEIVSWLKGVRFRRALFGISEQDVWKKLEELDGLYRTALLAERVCYLPMEFAIHRYRADSVMTRAKSPRDFHGYFISKQNPSL